MLSPSPPARQESGVMKPRKVAGTLQKLPHHPPRQKSETGEEEKVLAQPPGPSGVMAPRKVAGTPQKLPRPPRPGITQRYKTCPQSLRA